ncbi:MAG: DUF2384 domain-containing protein [Kordiimonadaceae bacterium]|nr:DUF2384 domain-containing protein [Kordiimonadaceae bacterium]
MVQQQVNPKANEGFNPKVLKDAATRKAYSNTAMKAFVRMMDAWDMSVDQRCAILGDIPRQTYHKWARGDVSKLSRDQLERIGIALGIYKGLNLLFNDEGGRLRWFKSLNHDYAFRGKSPAERMTEGGMHDLYAVRAYVDGLRGAH